MPLNGTVQSAAKASVCTSVRMKEITYTALVVPDPDIKQRDFK